MTEGSIHSDSLLETIKSIDHWSITRFIYNKSGSRINCITISEETNGESRLLFTHKFYYNKNKPRRSSVKDERNKQIIYRQTYTYSSSH